MLYERKIFFALFQMRQVIEREQQRLRTTDIEFLARDFKVCIVKKNVFLLSKLKTTFCLV